MWRVILVLIAVQAAMPAGVVLGEEAPRWVAVGPATLVEKIAPLAEYRRSEGFNVHVVAGTVEVALALRPDFLLLVGDEERGVEDAPWRTPAVLRRQYRWSRRQDVEFASDAVRGDVDGDLIPDIPVGRIPFRTAGEVAAAVERILLFERRPVRPEDLRILAWAGASGFGGAADRMATGLLTGTVRRHTPAWLGRFLLSAQPGHPLCGWPPEQMDVFNREYRRGGLLAAVISHASHRAVYVMEYEGKGMRYGVRQAEGAMGSGPPGPPLVILACLAGRFDRDRACLAEDLLSLPGGPVAVIAASAESHPLTNFYTGRALLSALDGGGRRLGAVWLGAQRAAAGAEDFLVERMLKMVEGSIEGELDTGKLKRDQALMYVLMGDPATKLKFPAPLSVAVEKLEDGWKWTVTKPEGARTLSAWIRSPRPRVRATFEAPTEPGRARERFEQASRDEAYRAICRKEVGESWSGTTQERGWLRIVAEGPDGVWVFVTRLRQGP